jgi:hypothetical protein
MPFHRWQQSCRCRGSCCRRIVRLSCRRPSPDRNPSDDRPPQNLGQRRPDSIHHSQTHRVFDLASAKTPKVERLSNAPGAIHAAAFDAPGPPSVRRRCTERLEIRQFLWVFLRSEWVPTRSSAQSVSRGLDAGILGTSFVRPKLGGKDGVG